MDNFLKKELVLAKRALIQAKTEQEYTSIISNINNLYNIQDELFINKQNSYNITKYSQLGMIQHKQEFIELVTQLMDIYANMPLLETESSIEYPTLSSYKAKNMNNLLRFWNYVFQNELSTLNMPLFTLKNVEFINCSAIKRIFTSGKCMVYNSFKLQQPKLILKRFYNIKDFITPCGNGIMMMSNINQINNREIINTLQYYIKSRALQIYQEINSKEAYKLHLINNDNLVYDARILRRLMNSGWDNLSLFHKGKLLDFVNNIMGTLLSEQDNVTLDSLLAHIYDNEEDFFDLCPYNEIIEKAKSMSLKYPTN